MQGKRSDCAYIDEKRIEHIQPLLIDDSAGLLLNLLPEGMGLRQKRVAVGGQPKLTVARPGRTGILHPPFFQ